jgi:hypothetical protein
MDVGEPGSNPGQSGPGLGDKTLRQKQARRGRSSARESREIDLELPLLAQSRPGSERWSLKVHISSFVAS